MYCRCVALYISYIIKCGHVEFCCVLICIFFQCVSGVLWWFVYFFVGSGLVQVEVLVVMVMVANLGRRAKVKGLRPSKNNPSFLGQVQKGASS